MSRIFLLEYDRAYSGTTFRNRPLRGTESCTVGLAEGLAELGHDVWVFTDEKQPEDYLGVKWRFKGELEGPDAPKADAAIANNHSKFFKPVSASQHIVWVHNPTNLHKAHRKGDFRALFKYRPKAVMGSHDIKNRLSRFLPFSERHVINHAVRDLYFSSTEERAAPLQDVLFFTLPYRGLDWTLDMWAEHIAPELPQARLLALIPDNSAEYFDILRDIPWAQAIPPIDRAEDVAELVKQTRVVISPGHKDETYCLAAVEAHCCGVPVMTRGHGALKERVRHGIDGYCTEDAEAFGKQLKSLLSDDALWREQHLASFDTPDKVSWTTQARKWVEALDL